MLNAALYAALYARDSETWALFVGGIEGAGGGRVGVLRTALYSEN